MKKQYMSYIGHTYVCKSKVQEAVFKFLNKNNRILFTDLEKFKRSIITGIHHINISHPRNKPVEVHWYDGYKPKLDDWSLNIPGICSFSIHQIISAKD